MKYFFYATDFYVYAVPKRYWQYLDIINSKNEEFDDDAVKEAISFIVENCAVKLQVSAASQYL